MDTTYAESLEAIVKALDGLVKALNDGFYKKGEDHDSHGD